MRYFFKSRRFKIAATILSTLVILAIIARIAGGIIAPHSSILGSLTAPLQSAFTSVSHFFTDWNDRINGNMKLAEENAALRDKVNELTESLIDYEAAMQENEFLREFLDIKEVHTDYQFEEAMLIARDSDDLFGGFTINKGSLHGISLYDPVIDASGLVGYISQVGPSYCKVTTVLSPDITVAAFDLRTDDSGLLGGTLTSVEKDCTRLQNLPRSCTVAIGDYIVTSGGGVFPEGMLIGTVEEIGTDYNSSIYAEVKPIVDFSDLRDVLVITYFSGQSNLGGE